MFVLREGAGSRLKSQPAEARIVIRVPKSHSIPAAELTSRRFDLRIIEETEEWIVVDKPPLIEVHPSKPGGARTLWDGLRDLLAYEIANGGQVSIINRLDRETSGLTLIAKNRTTARNFSRQMESRTIQKEYLAIVWGWPERDEWVMDAPLLRVGSVRPSPIYLKQGIHPAGLPALTRFVVDRRFRRHTTNGSEFALVRAFPETGRTHQIRVHLSESGHRIVGDKIYGPDENHYVEFIDTGWTPRLAESLVLPRHALHSTALRMGRDGPAWRIGLSPDLAAFADE